MQVHSKADTCSSLSACTPSAGMIGNPALAIQIGSSFGLDGARLLQRRPCLFFTKREELYSSMMALDFEFHSSIALPRFATTAM